MPYVSGKKYPYTKAGMKQQPQPKSGKDQEGEEVMRRGLYANIHAKRKRIKAGSGEKMRKAGAKGAPTAAAFRKSAKTAKKRKTRKA